jgi:hypothetical protein
MRLSPNRPCAALAAATALVLALLPPMLSGQTPPSPPDSVPAAYMDRYRALNQLTQGPARAVDVSHLVITRDIGHLVLERGRLFVLAPLGGRTVAAVFRGEGRFAFAPSLKTEQEALERWAETPELDDPITEAILLFDDSTAEQLDGLALQGAELSGDAGDDFRDLVNSLKGDKDGSFDGAVMGPLLNGGHSGFFLARVTRTRGDPVVFEFDPAMSEAARLLRPVGRSRWGSSWAVVTQCPPQQALPGSAAAWRLRTRLEVPHYAMDVVLSEAVSGNLGLAAGVTLTLVAREAVGPWLRFGLDPRLDLDSARWGGGAPAGAFKADDDGNLWVRALRRIQPGDTLTLSVFYHGTLIERFSDWFFVDPLAAWYPVNGQGPDLATYDITYHSPVRYPLISVGERADSVITSRTRTTRWVTPHATQGASFNLGLFQDFRVQHPDAPALNVLISEDAHRQLRRQFGAAGAQITEQAHMRENVAADVSNSLKLFTTLFGAPQQDHFTVSEIPFGEGVSFPGLIHLSWSTFQNTSLDGFDEFFRAHEAAHQWWGNAVRPGSYRDAWLSEGLASFSALWYVQSERHRDTEYFRFLDQYRSDIVTDQGVGPIWIGYRASSPTVPRGYDVMVYEKGAWVFHMLRMLMTDLRTMSTERFTDMLRDYYQSYRGGPATTEDFQLVVERHTGTPMTWFFDQWVKGADLPTYHVAWRSEPADSGTFRIRFRITQEHVPAEFRMPVLVTVDLGSHRVARFRITVSGAQTEYLGPLLPGSAREVAFNDLHSVLADVRTESW